VIDLDGVEWLPAGDAARRVRVRVETLRVWVHRGKVRQINEFLNMVDIMEAEHAWRVRLLRRNIRL
jgi:predicted site-specific integrase-resolvase